MNTQPSAIVPQQESTAVTAAFLGAVLYKASNLYELQISGLHALCILLQEDRVGLSKLSQELGFSTAAMTGLADRLVQLHLVDRQRDAADRRVVWLELTLQGKAALQDILNHSRDF